MTLLRQRMLHDMQIRNLAVNTQKTYLLQVSNFARHFRRSPEVLGPEEIRAWIIHLTNERKLAPASVQLAVGSLRFLYRITLRRDWSDEDFPLPKRPVKLPVILSFEEVNPFLRVDSQPETARHPDDGLCGRPACLRSRASEGHRYRQPADDDPCLPR
jgi:site-specific recombinase XerD